MNKKEKRLARCLAVQLLYSSEISHDYSSKKIVSSFFRRKDTDLDEVIYSKDEIDYATKLADYALKYIEDVDSLIQEKLVNWEMKRLAVMDKIILRMSISEMLYMEGIPLKVSMAEGIEIAKQFSTADSSRFINGILDAIYNDHKDNIDKKS